MSEMKECVRCKNEFPANSKYFRRDANMKDSWSQYCKSCAKLMSKTHNKRHYEKTIDRKGILGSRCPLWAEKCGNCRIVNDCWRLPGHIEGDERPAKLRGHLKGTLRKRSN